MIVPLQAVHAAVGRGVALTCATCTRYWKGRERGLPDDRCVTEEPCVGPFAGGSFPHYDGMLADFARWCLRCGGSATAAVRVAGQERAFGLCEIHLREAHHLAPAEGETHHLLEILRPTGLVSVESMVRAPRPFNRRSVAELLADFEREQGP